MSKTLGLAMIVRNGGAGLAACLDSVKDHVDQIVIVLAGESTDDTEKIARKYTKEVYPFEWVDNFAQARAFSFSKLKTDYGMWLDADDVLEGGEHLRSDVAAMEAQSLGALHMAYHYRHDDDGRCTVMHNRERIVDLALPWQWVPEWRVHEYLRCDGVPHFVGIAKDTYVRHTTNKANTERNQRLLDLMALEMPEDHPEYPRLLGCLQDISASTGRWLDSIKWGEKHFEAVEQTDVKWTAATELARAYMKLEDWAMVVHWSHVALSLHPEYSLPFLFLAKASWEAHHDSARALLYLSDADNARLEAPMTVFRQPEDYTIRRWDLEHRVLADQQRWEEALAVVKKAENHLGYLDKDGNRPNSWVQWDYFAWFYIERINCEKSVAGAAALVDHLCRRGDTLRAVRFLENDLPLSIRSDPRIQRIYARMLEFTKHVREPEHYQAFYDVNHSNPQDANHVMNGIDYEPYRMNVLLERLKAQGAKRVLDVGCGAGEPALFLAKNGLSVVGLDINSKSIAEARKRARKAQKAGEIKPYQAEFRVGSLDTLGKENLGEFDAVVMMELIEHLPPADVSLYFASAEDLTREGGHVYFTTPGMLIGDIPGIWDEFPRDHVVEFTRTELEALIMGSPSRRQKLPISLYKVYDPSVSIPGFASWFGEYEWHKPETDLGENWRRPVVFYIGEGLEAWDPRTPKETGLGGSETWAAEVARELRALGHPVVVYAAVDGVFDGVIYRGAEQYNPEAPFAGAPAWLTVISRHLEALDERPNSEHVLFVAHDVDYGDQLTAARLANMDAYCVMSEWHRQHTLETYAGSAVDVAGASDKIAVIQNGVDLSLFEGEAPERVPHSFIWGSSPDRGLDELLGWWPQIREMWPDATLDVFYGFNNMDALTPGRPWLPPFKRRLLELSRQEGVTLRGRIGQRELAREYQSHQFWLYPSRLPAELGAGEWHETFCIAALEAAAGGCVGIFPPFGALAERPGYQLAADESVLDVLKGFDDGRIALEPENLEAWTWREAALALRSQVRFAEVLAEVAAS